MHRFILLIMISISLTACAISPRVSSLLAQSQRDFDNGFYKRAQEHLLPIACDGNAEAQYALGYLYFYGYGVAQDKTTGQFWIRRAADQHYAPAIEALKKMS